MKKISDIINNLGEGQLITRWAKEINPEKVLPEYPRPQLQRGHWLNLNGFWDYGITKRRVTENFFYDDEILVPFPIESLLSGVKRNLHPSEKLWYRKFFTIPKQFQGERVIIHFGAIDWESQIYINSKFVGKHIGGYTAFSFDITNFLNDGENEIVVSVWDPTDRGVQEKGKQKLKPSLIYYTAISGIWQTVWLEFVPEKFISNVKIIPNVDNSSIQIKLQSNFDSIDYQTNIRVVHNKILHAEGDFKSPDNHTLVLENQVVWTPEDPYLNDVEITILDKNGTIQDSIVSYFGMRKIKIEKDNKNIPRIFLNDKQIFQYGFLDQGYWPDGLYTAPTEEALIYDIKIAKKLGFNLLRKHVKVEPSRWYHFCDKIGMLVWQDMPSGRKFMLFGGRLEAIRKNYRKELRAMINQLYNFPSIIMWIPFNEGWGQFKTKNITEFTKSLDQTRLINAASGWFDKKVGDIKDIHKYPGPAIPDIENYRVAVLGEFGGLGLKIDGHIWSQNKNWSYRKAESQKGLTQRYENLINQLQPMISKGLCGAVYTQLSDIEGEINGLLTYDREIVKINEEFLQKLHEKLFREK
ncbi:MAG: glycoside hydrolase family 2 protein [Candidatus Thorarchaeota archaeon]